MIEILLLVLIFNTFPILIDINNENRHYLESNNKLKHRLRDYQLVQSDLNHRLFKEKNLNHNISYKEKFEIEKESTSKGNFTFINYSAYLDEEPKNKFTYATNSFVETNHLANWNALSKDLKHQETCHLNNLNTSAFIDCDIAYIKNLSSDLVLANTGELVIENLNAKDVQIYSFDKVQILNSSKFSNTLIFSQMSEIEIENIDLTCSEGSFKLLSHSNKHECKVNKNLEYLLNFRPVSIQLY